MSPHPASDTVAFSLKSFTRARISLATADTILRNLITDDQLYLMPRDDSRHLIQHVAQLLDQASQALETDETNQELIP